MKVKGEMQVNEIEIFDGRRLCSDKLSSDLLPSRFICCTLLHFADHLVFCTCWNPPSPAAKVHTYSTTSSFLESLGSLFLSWWCNSKSGNIFIKKQSWVNQNRRGSVISASASFRYERIFCDIYESLSPQWGKSNIQQWKIKYECSWVSELSLHLQASFDRWNITSPVFKAVLL